MARYRAKQTGKVIDAILFTGRDNLDGIREFAHARPCAIHEFDPNDSNRITCSIPVREEGDFVRTIVLVSDEYLMRFSDGLMTTMPKPYFDQFYEEVRDE